MEDAEHNRRMRFAHSMLPLDMKGRLLDIGAYHGAIRKLIPPSVTYWGIDIIGKTELDITEWDLNTGKLPFDSNSFDYVLCCEVLEHTFYPEKIAREIARILKPTGIAIISLPNELGINGRFNALFRHPKSFDEQNMGIIGSSHLTLLGNLLESTSR